METFGIAKVTSVVIGNLRDRRGTFGGQQDPSCIAIIFIGHSALQQRISIMSIRNKVVIIALLGLASLSTAAMASVPYAGNWHAYFDGSNTGTCQIHIAPSGDMSGACKGKTCPPNVASDRYGACKGNLPPFHVQGKVVGNQVRFGVARTGAKFSGVMVSDDHGVGHWDNEGSSGGAWYIRRNR